MSPPFCFEVHITRARLEHVLGLSLLQRVDYFPMNSLFCLDWSNDFIFRRENLSTISFHMKYYPIMVNGRF